MSNLAIADSDGTMAEGEEPTKVSTESSQKVLKTVAGRLSKVEAGELPVIERVSADGSTHIVDHTGEMIRPGVDELDAAREAAERFAADHRANPVAPAPKQQPPSHPAESKIEVPEAEARPGLWARIMGWFKRS